jgi:protein involved in polysaccharide export with SLBB domain
MKRLIPMLFSCAALALLCACASENIYERGARIAREAATAKRDVNAAAEKAAAAPAARPLAPTAIAAQKPAAERLAPRPVAQKTATSRPPVQVIRNPAAQKPVQTPKPVAPKPAPAPQPKPAPAPAPEPEPEPEPVPAPAPEPEPAPVPPPVQVMAPQPAPEPVPAPQAEPAPSVRPASAGTDPAAYVLKANDVVQVMLRGIPQAEQIEDQIDTDGDITLPLINEVHAAGLTATELERLIRQRYIDAKIYQNVTVNVVIPARFYYMQGEIRSPGRYQLMQATRLSQAIAGAGGYTEFAAKSAVVRRNGAIFREIGNTRRLDRYPEDDILLEPDDIVIIDRSFW